MREPFDTRSAGAILTRLMLLCAIAGLLAQGMALAAEPDGKALYDKKCALCHGKDGVAKPAFAKKGSPNLSDPAWQESKTDEQITQAISEGAPGTMMTAFKDRLSPEEISAIVRHIRTLEPAETAK